jgi:hypothetical protein
MLKKRWREMRMKTIRRRRAGKTNGEGLQKVAGCEFGGAQAIDRLSV